MGDITWKHEGHMEDAIHYPCNLTKQCVRFIYVLFIITQEGCRAQKEIYYSAINLEHTVVNKIPCLKLMSGVIL